MEEVPAIVYDADAVLNEDVLTLAENGARSANVGRELLAISRLVEAGYKAGRISKDTKMAIGTVKRYVRLCEKLSRTLFDAVVAGKIGQTLATEIVKLPPARQQALEQLFVRQGRLSHEDVRGQRMVAAAQIRSAMPSELYESDMEGETGQADSPYRDAAAPTFTVAGRQIALGLDEDDVRYLTTLLGQKTDERADAIARRLRSARFAQSDTA
jgi:hypothetical protein